jgi:HK97 family phage prohead protease
MKQTRFIKNVDCGLQVREPEEGQAESRRVDGRPIIFGVRSVNLTPWSPTRKVYEILEPGCISNDLLQRSDVILNINHSNKVTDVLGRCNNGNGTLELGLRENYVQSSCELPMTNAANDTLELIKRGDISGMSFAFEDDEEDTENGVSYERTNEIEDGKEVWLRHVKRITGLYDVSIVTHPAYEQTSVYTREQGEEMLKCIDEQIVARQREIDAEEQAKAEEERELEEQAEKARMMKTFRLRSMRRRLNDNSLIY